MNVRNFRTKEEAERFYYVLRNNPVRFSVNLPRCFGDVWQVTYREWSVD